MKKPLRLILLIPALLLAATPVLAQPAAEPPAPAAEAAPADLPYATTLMPSGVEALDEPLRQASRLIRLSDEAPVDSFGLVARALGEPPLLDAVLRAEGYWAAVITVRVAGEPADAAGLAQRLANAPPGAPVPVEVRIAPGPRYSIRRVALRPDAQAAAPAIAALGAPPGIAPGDPARSGPVLDAETALIDRLRVAGYPLAAVVDREVLVNHEEQAMDVTWILAPGPQTRFAPPEIAGDTAVSRRLLARIANRLSGEPYAPATQEATRRQLLALGAFDSVRARAAARLDAEGRLPVTFTFTDRPRNAAGATLAYETNFGPSASVYYERRNVFGNAERLRLEASASRLGGDAEDNNYRIGANLRRPGLFDGRTSLVLDAAVLRERLDAYDRDAITTSALLERPFGARWVLQAGPTFETGKIGRDGDMQAFTLAGFVMGARYDNTDDPLDPRRGYRLSATVTPYMDVAEGGGFARAIGSARGYFSLVEGGGTVLALRGTLGSLVGADRAVPLDKRFYAGGGGSVRGYAYQAIGPQDSQNRPNGGASLVEGSVEIRQRISGALGMVAFLDGGSVGQAETPSFEEVRFGAGLGVRYGTAIGPLRLDVAVPLNKQQGDDGYGLYVGLGQAF
ncbi:MULTISPECIES: autotransporter assembly complex protein TamA [Roseomonadaceae]|uniref:BamA/TamA family outer membrane protein n=1 Tax=Falsiroseomonas oleicola TaxID=2801474 RepID=A0ABS6HC17_9PROT|nr:BamA/TamA family outer membrane protein [Roseomonas oleicola]MBU8545228.1 BamA/TamA family outer membrane protein [Roseomonas oleicola]